MTTTTNKPNLTPSEINLLHGRSVEEWASAIASRLLDTSSTDTLNELEDIEAEDAFNVAHEIFKLIGAFNIPNVTNTTSNEITVRDYLINNPSQMIHFIGTPVIEESYFDSLD